jgi:hypothetical protein
MMFEEPVAARSTWTPLTSRAKSLLAQGLDLIDPGKRFAVLAIADRDVSGTVNAEIVFACKPAETWQITSRVAYQPQFGGIELGVTVKGSW